MVFEKLYKFIGKNIKSLIDRADEPHCFRLQKNKVYYVKERLMKKATNVSSAATAALTAWANCTHNQPHAYATPSRGQSRARHTHVRHAHASRCAPAPLRAAWPAHATQWLQGCAHQPAMARRQ